MLNDLMPVLTQLFNAPVFNWLADQNVSLLSPELCVLSGLLFTLFKGTTRHQGDAWLYGMISLAFAMMCLLSQYGLVFMPQLLGSPLQLSGGALALDSFSWMMRLFLLLGTVLTMLMSKSFVAKRTQSPAEFYTLLLAALLGGLLLAGAKDLVLLFVSLETLSISSYILTGYFREDARSIEASFKYLTYGGACSAILLFGFSLLYGLSGGQVQLDAIASVLQVPTVFSQANMLLLPVLALMVLTAFSFKLSLAPFHLWAPDVYEGAPTPVAAFLSVVSKTAAFAIVIRLLQTLFPGVPGLIETLSAIALISMLWGNVVAIMQTDIKRLFAFSTVAQAGYMVLGLLTGSAMGISALLFYLLGYLFTNMGAFAVIKSIEADLGSTRIADMAGLVQKRPTLVLCLTLFCLSLAGLPITVGFFAKFFLFQTVINQQPGLLWLVVVALLTSVVSLFYYLNVIRVMVVSDPSDAVRYLKPLAYRFLPSGTAIVVSVCLALVITVGLASDMTMSWIQHALTPVVTDAPSGQPFAALHHHKAPTTGMAMLSAHH
jgi:NAD(P)H-quinone oxidoreductase subunit 2